MKSVMLVKLEDSINKLSVSVAKIEATLPSLATKAEIEGTKTEIESVKTHVANSTRAIIISLILLLGGSTVFERLFPPTVNVQSPVTQQTSK